MDLGALVALVVILAIAVALAVGGVRVGMLLAPRIERWGTPPDAGDEGSEADERR
jgi:hypothetical protein